MKGRPRRTLKERQRRESVRYFGFEDIIEKLPSFAELRRLRPVKELQDVALNVWHSEGGSGECFRVVAVPNGKYSWCHYTKRTIELVPKHRNVGSVLHELAHALTMRDKLAHGPAFRRRCIRLYKVYGGWSGEVE